MEQFSLLRIQYPSFDEGKFQRAISELHSTRYVLGAMDAQAPQVTHCISAVRYALSAATGWSIPRYYVGDMARGMLDDTSITARLIPIDQGEQGDLVFFQRNSRRLGAYMITHVGILLDEDKFFHSSPRRGGGVESIGDRLTDGTLATCNMLTRYTDPRRQIISFL